MKRKILGAMLVLFAASAAGSALAIFFIKSTTEELRGISELHRLEEMRQHLISGIQGTQTDLFTVDTPVGPTADRIADNVLEVERAAAACGGCHHEPTLAARLASIRTQLAEYETSLSQLMTASANLERIQKMRLDAAARGAELLRVTEEMAEQASARADQRVAAALRRFDHARIILSVSIVLTLLVAVGIAWLLATSIVRPIGALVKATREIQAGQLGFSVELDDRTELGELARHLNAMSAALRDGYAALQSEIEERRRAEERLLYDAFHDVLTGLPNRALFLDRLQHVIETSRRHGDQIYAVLFLDLDGFKAINDTLGHVVGDHLLVSVGERLAECLRPGDTVARLGGDEFGILLDRIGGPADVTQVAERIRRGLGRPLQVDGQEVVVTASVGIALRADRYQRPEQVLRDADVAMYQAKMKGKARAETFDPETHVAFVDRLALEAELRRAVELGDDLLLHYQPIVALRTGKLIGVEALVRWRKPGCALVEATELIPLAEQSGILLPIGDWVLKAGCRQLRRWQDQVPALQGVTLSLNVSALQFRRPDFVETFCGNIREAGVDPRLVAIELTESTIMADAEASADKLARLRDLGVQVHVDDFGTGDASLSYLHRFPITAVKIDPSFVAGLPGHVESEEVVRAVVSIAESLDFDVIAEGVEAPTQVAKLEELRCRYAQGFLVATPMTGAELEAWALSSKACGVA